MIRYSSEAVINRPPRDVFEALIDPERYPQWTEMTDVRFDTTPPHVGTSGSFRLAKGPFKDPMRVELVELEPERRVVFNVTSRTLDWKSVAELEPADGGTRLVYSGEMALHGWKKLLEPIIGAEVRAGEGKEVERLKALLEGASNPQASASTVA